MTQPPDEQPGEPGAITRSVPPRQSRSRLRRWVRRGAIVSIALPLLGWLAFTAAVAWWPYPSGIDRPPTAGTWIEDRNGRPLAALVGADDQWQLPLAAEQISPHLLNAIVAVEDSRFYEHHGVDWRSTAYAVWQDASSLHIKRGASTITMQLQRLRDPRPRTFWNKFEQAVRGAQIEKTSGKQAILVEYLNRAPFGGNLVGSGAASWRYFGRPCRDLSLGEAALLAGLPQNPNRLRPDRFPEKAKARRDHVLDRMLACKMIDQRQHDEAAAEPVVAGWKPLPQMEGADRSVPRAGSSSVAGNVVPASESDSATTCATGGLPARVLRSQNTGGQAAGGTNEVGTNQAHREKLSSLASGAMPTFVLLSRRYPGQRIVATIDAGVQHQAAAMAGEHLRRLEASGVTAVAVVVLDTPTGECLASVSLSRQATGVDLTRRPRSTGSTLKPFIYGAAFDAGVCTSASMLNDSPNAWPGYAPSNYDHDFRGPMTAGEALAESRNLPAMVVLGQVGVDRAVAMCDALGMHGLARSKHGYGLSLAIGGAEATPLELAEAYATLARGGMHKPAALVRERPAVEGQRVMREDACREVLLALSTSDRTARVSPEAATLHVAWKTGTSSGHKDAWCAAVTPRRTVVVWLGNPGGATAASLVGTEEAAPLALRLIASLDKGGASWPGTVAHSVAASTPRVGTWSRPSVVITSPTPGQEILLAPDLTADRQRVALRATCVTQAETGTLWWFVDNEPVGTSTDGQTIWWPPTAGSHQIRAVDTTGHSAAVGIRVRTP